MTSDLLVLATADVSWQPDYVQERDTATASDERIDALAQDIEAQIEAGEEVLAAAPDFELGQRIRSRPKRVTDLIDD
jgi:hypothetical protein